MRRLFVVLTAVAMAPALAPAAAADPLLERYATGGVAAAGDVYVDEPTTLSGTVKKQVHPPGGPLLISSVTRPARVELFEGDARLLSTDTDAQGRWSAPHVFAEAGTRYIRIVVTGDEARPGEGTTWLTVRVRPPPPACADGADNDGDGLVDHPADPGCWGPEDTSEVDPPPPGLPPGPVRHLVATNGPLWDEATLSWTAPADAGSGVSGYRAYASASPEGPWTSAPWWSSDRFVLGEGEWHFRVEAYGPGGTGPSAYASLAIGPRPAADAVEAEILRVRVCDRDGARCTSATPGGGLAFAYDVEVVVTIFGAGDVERAGRPMRGAPVEGAFGLRVVPEPCLTPVEACADPAPAPFATTSTGSIWEPGRFGAEGSFRIRMTRPCLDVVAAMDAAVPGEAAGRDETPVRICL